MKTVRMPHADTSTKREVVVWVIVIYSLALIFFVVLSVGFGVSLHKSKLAEAAKTNHVLYDQLNTAENQQSAV